MGSQTLICTAHAYNALVVAQKLIFLTQRPIRLSLDMPLIKLGARDFDVCKM